MKSVWEEFRTYCADKALFVPVGAKSLDDKVRDWLSAFPALATVAVCVASDTPCIPISFHKRRRAVEGISALSAEEMPSMPFGAACNDDLALDRSLTAFAARAERLVVIQMAVEPQSRVSILNRQILKFGIGQGLFFDQRDSSLS